MEGIDMKVAKAWLETTEDSLLGEKRFELSTPILIGRDGREGDVKLLEDDGCRTWGNYVRASRKQAIVNRDNEGSFYVEDLGSLVGTYLNGNKLGQPWQAPLTKRYLGFDDSKIREGNKGKAYLHDGDIITIGPEFYGLGYEITFRQG